MTLEEKYESLLSTMLTMREQLAKADAEVEALTAQLDEALKAFGSADRSRVALTTTLSATQKELEQRVEDLEKAAWYLRRLIATLKPSVVKPPNVISPGEPGSDVQRCKKCNIFWNVEKLNPEGWCFDCFSAPTQAAVRQTCGAFWNKTAGRPGYVCQLAYGHDGAHSCIDGDEFHRWSPS